MEACNSHSTKLVVLAMTVLGLLGSQGCSSAKIFNDQKVNDQKVEGATIKLAWDAPLPAQEMNSTKKKAKKSKAELPKEGTVAAGYKILAGREAGQYTDEIDVGNVLSYTVQGLTVGQTYCFAIVAYNSDRVKSGPSQEICAQAR